MRLINTQTIQLRQFISEIPPYAILSHRWRSDPSGEATLQELHEAQQSFAAIPSTFVINSRQLDSDHFPSPQSEQSPPQARDTRSAKPSENHEYSPGIQKVADFCHIAKDYGYEWAWIDTACIDKTNSTELSEAINSMFQWYMNCECCFVYLHDMASDDCLEIFDRSDWFTRGWTLQELIAPTHMVFCGSDWKQFGTKDSLRERLSASSGVPAEVLADPLLNFCYSTAQRMSWAANRNTTRGEDISYCLLGLFDINLPLLYGEGARNAFERMQIQILQNFEDESVLAWELNEDDQPAYAIVSIYDTTLGTGFYLGTPALTGVLAWKPRHFLHSGNVVKSRTWVSNTPLRITSRGLEVVSEVHGMSGVAVRDALVGGGAEEMNDPTVVTVRLACNQTAPAKPCYMILIKDPTSIPTKRWCRIMFTHAESEFFTELMQYRQRELAEKRLFVRISWPVSGYRHHGVFSPNLPDGETT